MNRLSFLKSLLAAPLAVSFMARASLVTPERGMKLERVGMDEYIASWGNGHDLAVSQTWEKNSDGSVTLVAEHYYPEACEITRLRKGCDWNGTIECQIPQDEAWWKKHSW